MRVHALPHGGRVLVHFLGFEFSQVSPFSFVNHSVISSASQHLKHDRQADRACLLLQEGNYDGRPHSMCVYTPSRTVAVYALSQFCDAKGDAQTLGVPGLGVKDRGPNFER